MSAKPVILFVDDEERILKSLKLLFRNHYEVRTSTDGAEAVAMVRQEDIHVIVCDQRMPGMTGVEVLREVRLASPNTMRLLLTGYSDLAAIVGSVNEGEVFRYINKPWDNQQVEGVVGQAVEIAQHLRHLPQNEGYAPLHPDTGDRLGILVVDDDRTTWQAVEATLGDKYAVYWADTQKSAMDILVNKKVAVLVSEISVGGEDMAECLQALKQYFPGIISLVVTAFQDATMLVNLINQAQIYRFVAKPVVKGLLQRNIESCLQHYHSCENNPALLEQSQVDARDKSSFSRSVAEYINRLQSAWER